MTTTLAEKYRPRTFEQVVAQETAVKILSGLIHPEKRGGHVILYGPAGTGKTTLARLYGKALHCKSPNEGSPCYECYLCRQAESHGFGYVEIDGSKGHSIDSVREILRDSSENLLFGDWWVVFVDEAQGFG